MRLYFCMGVKKLKTALITGISGQDGYYLAVLLLEKGYIVHGLVQPLVNEDISDLESLKEKYGANKLHIHVGDLTDGGSLTRILNRIQPTEIYNLGAQSHVAKGFDVPEYTGNINGLGTLRLLETLRALNRIEDVRFYQASTSEMFGNAPSPQYEATPFSPCSPYASSKLYAHNLVRNYRDAYGLYGACGILFNHESPRRGNDFVTQKVCKAVANITRGTQKIVELGNLDAVRDWGHAKDYVEGMWIILQQDKPEDYVLATGQGRSVRQLCEIAFRLAGIDLGWSGDGVNETGFDKKSGETLIKVNPKHYRPNEVENLIGCADKAEKELGWKPRISFQMLIKEMLEAQLGNEQHADKRKSYV